MNLSLTSIPAHGKPDESYSNADLHPNLQLYTEISSVHLNCGKNNIIVMV